jgi:hypothetical protein
MLRLSVCAVLLAGAACSAPTDSDDDLQTMDVATRDLPAADLSRTWRYRPAIANADSVLRAVRRAGIPLEEGWQPLEDLCMDPVGPRLTVVLRMPDDRIRMHDFESGSGIRACTVRVRRYLFRG